MLIIINMIQEYETALYGFIAVYVSQQMFGNIEVQSLIYTYTLLATGTIAKPFALVLMQYLTELLKIEKILTFLALGMSLVSISISLIPSYNEIGYLAILVLSLLKITQNILATIEVNISNMYFFDKIENQNTAQASSYYNVTIIIAVLLASISGSCYKENWQILYLYSGVCSGVVFLLRAIQKDKYENVENRFITREPIPNISAKINSSDKCFVRSAKYLIDDIFNNKLLITQVISLISLSYITYFLSFIIIDIIIMRTNSHILESEILVSRNLLLLFDGVLLVLFGFLSRMINYKYIMLVSSLVITVTIPLLIDKVSVMSIRDVYLFKALIITCGVGLCGFVNAYIFELCKYKNHYSIFGIGAIIGGEYIASPLTSATLKLYETTSSLNYVGLYVSIISIVVLLSLIWNIKNTYKTHQKIY